MWFVRLWSIFPWLIIFPILYLAINTFNFIWSDNLTNQRSMVKLRWNSMGGCITLFNGGYCTLSNILPYARCFWRGILYNAYYVIYTTLSIETVRVFGSTTLCNTGELDRHAQHQQPCLASRTPRVVVRQKQPVLSGTHCSSFVHRQMSVVFCSQRFPMKIENYHIRHQRTPQGHQRPPR